MIRIELEAKVKTICKLLFVQEKIGKEPSTSDAKARLGLETPAQARLFRARASKTWSLSPQPSQASGPGSQGLVLCYDSNLALLQASFLWVVSSISPALSGPNFEDGITVRTGREEAMVVGTNFENSQIIIYLVPDNENCTIQKCHFYQQPKDLANARKRDGRFWRLFSRRKDCI